MSESNYENYQDSDYDDNRGDLVWNEFDWQEYLNQNKREINQFINLYQNADNSFNPFDAVTGADGDNQNPFEFNPEEGLQEVEMNPDPYTIHKHPLFIVAKGLTLDICQSWEKLLVLGNSGITPVISWQFARVLQDIEYHINAAVYATDITEPSLGVAHLKNSLSGINEAIRVLMQIAPLCRKEPNLGHFENIKMSLFNLRGACMRIQGECREQDEEPYFE